MEIITHKKIENFIVDLKKHVEFENNSAKIEVYLNNYAVWEEFTHQKKWNETKYTIKIIIDKKGAEYEYDGNLIKFIDQIKTLNFDQLNNSNLDISFIEERGGNYLVDEVIWDKAANEEDKKGFNPNQILSELLDDGTLSDCPTKEIWSKGSIYEINVVLQTKIIKLIK